MKTPIQYLSFYFGLQQDITLVYRPHDKTWWGNRVKLFTREYYDKYPFYNHRSILNNEVVIEFDKDTKEENLLYTRMVEDKLKNEGVSYKLWFSGGKSYHIHTLWDMKNISNPSVMKKVIMEHYSPVVTIEGVSKKVSPDMQLKDNNHLIRLEYSLHEKSGNKKRYIRSSGDYTKINTISEQLWEEYATYKEYLLKIQMTRNVNSVIESPEIKYLLSSSNMKKIGDGKKRILFILINILKKNTQNTNGKYENKEELTNFLYEWYKYSDGYEYSKQQIKRMVDYYWEKDYSNMGITYIRTLLDEVTS